MKMKYCALAALVLAVAGGAVAKEKVKEPPTVNAREAVAPSSTPAVSDADLAKARYDEMLTKMQNAVEEVAHLYGNPVFVQLHTNDREKAEEFRRRLANTEGAEALKKELAALNGERETLRADIALKQRESALLVERLAKQRATLDAVIKTLEAAQKALEGGVK